MYDTIVPGSDMNAQYTVSPKKGSACFYKSSSGYGSSSAINSILSNTFAANQPLSVCFWYKSLVVNPSIAAIFQAEIGFNPYASFRINGSGTSMYFQTSTRNWGNPTSLPNGITNVNDGNWYYICLVLNGTNINWYINNMLAGTPIPYSGIPSGKYTFSSIGTDWNQVDYYQGTGSKLQLDEFRFYSKALTVGEISILYNA